MKYTMRMRELEIASGLSASSIRFYLKQGLLPEPKRPTPNSALYGQAHINALSALKRIKSLAPGLPIVQIKRVMDLIDKGVEPEVALSLHRAVAHGDQSDPESYTQETLAAAAEVDGEFIDQLVDAKILVPMKEQGEARFDHADLQVLKAVIGLQDLSPIGLEIVAKVAAHIQSASKLEMEMRNLAAQSLDPQQTARISYQMQEWGNFWHAYLFARFRLQDIEEHGLGDAEQSV